ncbi:MAG: NADH-quinone oxidoreductase subunit M [Leptolyngbyaceae cyanobacterium]
MLSPFVWLPLVGALVIGVAPLTAKKARTAALVTASLTALWSLNLFTQFDLSDLGFQITERLTWIPQIGLDYELGLDGLALLMVGLNSLLTWIVLFSSATAIERPRLFFSLILIVNSVVSGAFLAQNFLLFFLLYEIELVPLYLLISIWGGEKRGYAATKFLLYTAMSGALILVGCFGIFWLSGADDFSYGALAAADLPLNWQITLLIPLLLGFGIKVPLVPLHTWLPDTYVAASPPVAIMLGGVLAKLGTYGLLRFGFCLLPEGWQALAPGLAVWAAISVMYGAIVAIAQPDIKRMVAYSSVGHMGYILLGMAAGTPLSLAGCIALMVSHGLILAILFHLVGIVEAKVGTRELSVLNGLMNPIRGLPLVSALLVLGGMASAGIPGLVNFAAEFVVFQGSYRQFPIQTLICVVGTGLTAVYFVILLNRTCFGRLDNDRAYFPKVTLEEQIPAFILTALIVFLGLQPNWLMRWTESTPAATVAEALEPAPVSFNFREAVPLAFSQIKSKYFHL